MKKLSMAAIILASVMALTACGSNANNDNGGAPSTGGGEADAAKVTVLKVARNAVPNPPFSYLNDKNEMEGYTVEYLKLLDERLEEYQFEYEEIAREAMLVGVESGKYDFAANFYYRNPEREAKYLFSDVEYGYSLNALIVKDDRDDIHSLDDMKGKKLTPMSPSTGLRTLVVDYNTKNADNPIIVEDIDAVTDAESVQWVASGKYDAFLTNTTVFDNVNAQLKLPLKSAAYITKEPIWVLYNKEKKDLAARFDEVTKAMVEDGTLPALSEKYFKVNMFQSLEDVNSQYQFK
ncbi:transporter substrate-binding domain-containing protein [Paenibacillus nasutitermitis]|uniref:Amino acid ABC transporter substrate-binding protein n=1 Tax=Paenibacillus nasutitermitis TaxID=1652958 RepID=A0A917DZV6_9BACL|nr:transporter substrate-binding domain-containing protein [Paenibacillus nasutitermitis]GGD88620.1 amino acid ABC transporter substrate-binding protein [Paenibacillus nasutitermitis]